ncbi:hypothetical protein [Pseudalkalibacillus berkeleyi]|uniref:Lipoprotein n=1 Tax=Pseudalkalibacillus berkeleyi TaxID=1069813 RepID=A0ABS9H404_9BACL|nr:hypothetical protein [Pseudalkalibacillus berkeleyi]MCF6139629.1 hypothetical protein [Pseudalkalibacillus berkeleyi]
MFRLLSVFVLSLSILMLAGCGSVANGSGESKEQKPPKATITIEDKEVSYKEGSYCWSTSYKGVCADTGGAEELTEDTPPLVVSKSGNMQISYEQDPSSLHVMVLKDGAEHQTFKDQYELKIPEEPGTYVYGVFAKWENQGDSFIAYKIKVK